MAEKSKRRSKEKVTYQGFALAVPLIQEIKNHIKDDPAYRSVTDYVRQAVREKMQYEKSSIWSETAIRDYHKLKRFVTKKNDDQEALKELIRTVIREEKTKK